MTKAKQNLKVLKQQYAMIEELNESFEGECSGVDCGECPFYMGANKLPFDEGTMTSCAFAAMGLMLQKVIKNTSQKTLIS
ncbi:MAG: hypothetical protein WAO24_01100 [Peptococcia bacterium]